MKIIFLFLFVFLISEIVGFSVPQPKGIKSSNRSLVYTYDINGSFYSKFLFTDLNFQLPFTCENGSSIRTCTSYVDEEIAKNLHGSMSSCVIDEDGSELCGSFTPNTKYYPNPIIQGEFKPPTKGSHTIIKGYYLVLGITYYLTIIPNMKVPFVGFFYEESFDATNLILDYKGGCGEKTFQWPNGFKYSFNHSNPTIDKISSDNSSLVAIGSNFCSNSNDVNIFIDGIQVDKINLISIDHELFEVRYTQQYCKSIYVNIVSGGLESNKIKFEFKPLPLKINSIPKVKGGLITITGERLSSQINNSSIIVKIGNHQCKNIISSQHEITCNLDPVQTGSNDDSIGLHVNVSINGIVNDNILLFSFDVPFIYDFILPQGQVKLIGDCLGTNESTQIYIDDIQQLNLTININDKQTTLLFTPLNQIKNSKLYIIVNGKKSNVIQIDSSFFVKLSPLSPSVLGQIVNITLYNVNILNHNNLPTLTFMDNTTIKGIDNLNSNEYSNHTYSFEIPIGCGRNGISISIGNQTTHSELYYELPIITSCSINNDQIIRCFGNFTNYFNFYENGKINILFSNSIDEIYLPTNSIDFKIDSFSFQLNKKYKTNQVYFNVCNELLPIINIEYNSTIQTPQPTIINTLKPQLNSSSEQEIKQNKTNSNSYSSNENMSNKQKNEKIPSEGVKIQYNIILIILPIISFLAHNFLTSQLF
ncbi:hypothetical protein ACTFIZ_006845 [Dictyostelium cf. discoideum]